MMPKVFSDSTPVARKEHKCCECHGKINIGETYYSAKGIWEKPESFKMCLGCKDVFDAVSSNVDAGDEPPFEGLREFILEEMNHPIADFVLAYSEQIGVDSKKLAKLLKLD